MRFILHSGSESHPFDIPEGATVIGRQDTCHLTIKSQAISRQHVECIREGGSVRVRDLGSANGTYVNGKRTRDAVILKQGDIVKIGDVKMEFVDSAAQANPSPAAAAFHDIPESAPPLEEMPPGSDSSFGAPLDAEPAEYREDEHTPADGTFMPEIYRPEGPPQPMLNQRNGRWYLRDPRTNREVEIVPKGQEAASSEEVVAKQKQLITYSVITAVALVAVIILSSVIWPSSNSAGPPGHEVSRGDYTNAIARAIALFESNESEKFDRALEVLNHADSARPDLTLARAVADYFQLVQAADGNIADVDFRRASSLLRGIRERGMTDSIRTFAESQQDTLQRTQSAMSRMNETRNLVAEGKVEEAYTVAVGIPPENPVRIANEDFIAELRLICLRDLTSRGDRAKGDFNWDESIKHYEAAKRYAPSQNHVSELSEKQRNALRGREDMASFTEARELYEAKQYTGAQTLLERITLQSPYYERAQALLKRVAEEQAREHVLTLYNSGNGEEALAYLRQTNVTIPGFPKRIDDILQALRDARAASERGSLSAEIAAYQRILAIEPNTENAYNRRARITIERLQADPTLLAREFLQQAEETFKREDFQAARRFAEMAMAIDNQSGSGIIRTLDNRARNSFISGQALVAQGNTEGAIEKFRDTLKCAKPDSDYHNRARDELDKLGVTR